MKYIAVLVVVFFILFFAPFVGAITYCYKRKGRVLHISQENKKDARYFGKAFSNLVEKNLDSIHGNTIMLSHKETFMDADKVKALYGEVKELVICLGRDYYAPQNVRRYFKEIYCDRNMVLCRRDVMLRAAYAREQMLIGTGISVDRWIDAEKTIAIYDDCDLGISASAGKRMSIGMGCTFRRLFAPETLIGQYPDCIFNSMSHKKQYIFEVPKQLEVVRNISVVDRELVNERNEAEITIVTKSNLSILEDMIVKGDVKSHKGVRLCENAVVCGNIFAEHDVYIGVNAVVLGNIFTQGSVFVEKNAMIGQRGKIVSVIAREQVVFDKNVTVYGFVSCEAGGKVLDESGKHKQHEYRFLSYESIRTKLIFDDLDEYEKLSEKGFRKDEALETVEICVSAKRIPNSFCFSCRSLYKVVCPDTVKEIGAFAFADCINLKYFTNFAQLNIKTIYTSAFENCEQLKKIEFSKELEVLGGAAFAGCKNLRSVKFSQDSVLREIGDHCFSGCEKLEHVELPDSVNKIGVSAFSGCLRLKKIMIPEGCETQPGIMEIKENPEIVISIRHRGLMREVTT